MTRKIRLCTMKYISTKQRWCYPGCQNITQYQYPCCGLEEWYVWWGHNQPYQVSFKLVNGFQLLENGVEIYHFLILNAMALYSRFGQTTQPVILWIQYDATEKTSHMLNILVNPHCDWERQMIKWLLISIHQGLKLRHWQRKCWLAIAGYNKLCTLSVSCLYNIMWCANRGHYFK